MGLADEIKELASAAKKLQKDEKLLKQAEKYAPEAKKLADLNKDGKLDAADLQAAKQKFGKK